MPTPEEIKSIAEQYAEFTDMSPVDQLRVKLISKEFLTWVCKTHCIVPKSKVKEKYALSKMGYTECEGLELGYVMDALEDLFGKSLFNEEKG